MADGGTAMVSMTSIIRGTIIGVTMGMACGFGAGAPAFAGDTGLAGAHSRQDAAVSRSGSIPGLGRVSAAIYWDSRQELVLHTTDVEVSRTLDPLTRETTIQIRGDGEPDVTIRLGGPDGFSVARAGRAVRGTTEVDAIRAMLGGRSVAAARARFGALERHLAAGAAARLDDPHAYGFMLVGALLSALHGDPAAVGRARDLMLRRAQGRVRAVRFDFQNCVQDYEKYLLDLDTDRTNCLEAANSRSTWYARAGDRLACAVEFMAGAIAGEGQFVSCTALGSIL